jgi:hypothetical protein
VITHDVLISVDQTFLYFRLCIRYIRYPACGMKSIVPLPISTTRDAIALDISSPFRRPGATAPNPAGSTNTVKYKMTIRIQSNIR